MQNLTYRTKKFQQSFKVNKFFSAKIDDSDTDACTGRLK